MNCLKVSEPTWGTCKPQSLLGKKTALQTYQIGKENNLSCSFPSLCASANLVKRSETLQPVGVGIVEYKAQKTCLFQNLNFLRSNIHK